MKNEAKGNPEPEIEQETLEEVHPPQPCAVHSWTVEHDGLRCTTCGEFKPTV